jgi:hypothetical protein
MKDTPENTNPEPDMVIPLTKQESTNRKYDAYKRNNLRPQHPKIGSKQTPIEAFNQRIRFVLTSQLHNPMTDQLWISYKESLTVRHLIRFANKPVDYTMPRNLSFNKGKIRVSFTWLPETNLISWSAAHPKGEIIANGLMTTTEISDVFTQAISLYPEPNKETSAP